jgi:N-methylhydantoinase B/oxoprolinase/acetone carboxylase alpha subunit
MGALAQAIPDKVIAATYGTCNNFTGGGKNPETGEDYVFYFFTEGGWGAAPNRDGWNCTPNQTSNFKDYPAEIIESQFPLIIEGVELNEDSAGPGRYRGGFGTIRKMRTLSEKTRVNALGERHRIKPWGVFGGYPAKKDNGLWVRKRGQSEFKTVQEVYKTVSPSKFANLILEKDDAFAIVTTGGGGYGNPLERDLNRILKDVDEELISIEAAREDYGVVVIRDEAGEPCVDQEATEEVRRKLAYRRPENVIYGVISVDDRFMECKERLVDEGVTKDPYAPKIAAIANAIETYADFCRSECIKKGDGKRCPYYNDESLAFWGFENLVSWTRRQCPLSPKLSL